MKNRIFGLVLLFCFVAPIVTVFGIIQYQKKQVKREVKWKMIAGMERDELVLLKFTEKEKNTQLRWEHSKEFEYKGEMYDIVETNIMGDTTYYWVWWDHEETQLNKQLDVLVAIALGNNPNSGKNQKQLHDFFKSLYFVELPSNGSLVFTEQQSKCFAEHEFHHSFAQSPLVPPPEKS